jgi:hypothetical protein
MSDYREGQPNPNIIQTIKEAVYVHSDKKYKQMRCIYRSWTGTDATMETTETLT